MARLSREDTRVSSRMTPTPIGPSGTIGTRPGPRLAWVLSAESEANGGSH